MNQRILEETDFEAMFVQPASYDAGEAYLGALSGDTEMRADDTLLLYGVVGRVKELDRRLRGGLGDAKHAEAVEERARRSQEEERAVADAVLAEGEVPEQGRSRDRGRAGSPPGSD